MLQINWKKIYSQCGDLLENERAHFEKKMNHFYKVTGEKIHNAEVLQCLYRILWINTSSHWKRNADPVPSLTTKHTLNVRDFSLISTKKTQNRRQLKTNILLFNALSGRVS